jgi:hypothetical protein
MKGYIPMNTLAREYEIPPELMAFVESGFLKVLAEEKAEKTVEFHIPSKRTTDAEGRITTFSVIWIHPQFNAQFCHYYDKVPGDLPNFYVVQDTMEVGDEMVAGLETVPDLVEWLRQLRETVAA